MSDTFITGKLSTMYTYIHAPIPRADCLAALPQSRRGGSARVGWRLCAPPRIANERL